MMKWVWEQASGISWVVESDSLNGTIKVYIKDNGAIVTERKNLTTDAVKLIEENFFDVVAKRIVGAVDPMFG